MTDKVIRSITSPEEIEAALTLAWEVFSETDAPMLSDEAIDAFWRSLDLEYIAMAVGEGSMTVWGAYEDDALVGMCAFRGMGHVEMIYVSPARQGAGIGASLLKMAASQRKAVDPSLGRLTVYATPSSEEFFSAMGFLRIGETIEEDGLTFLPMAVDGVRE